jgi:hypothetical protein
MTDTTEVEDDFTKRERGLPKSTSPHPAEDAGLADRGGGLLAR